jgi:hypothetical protein
MNAFGRIVAGFIFLLLTILFIKISNASSLGVGIELGLTCYYLLTWTAPVYFITFIFLIIRCVAENNFKDYKITFILMLMNIPLALLYWLFIVTR